MKFHCPNCNQCIEAQDDWAGQEGECPNCSCNLTIPSSSGMLLSSKASWEDQELAADSHPTRAPQVAELRLGSAAQKLVTELGIDLAEEAPQEVDGEEELVVIMQAAGDAPSVYAPRQVTKLEDIGKCLRNAHVVVLGTLFGGFLITLIYALIFAAGVYSRAGWLESGIGGRLLMEEFDSMDTAAVIFGRSLFFVAVGWMIGIGITIGAEERSVRSPALPTVVAVLATSMFLILHNGAGLWLGMAIAQNPGCLQATNWFTLSLLAVFYLGWTWAILGILIGAVSAYCTVAVNLNQVAVNLQIAERHCPSCDRKMDSSVIKQLTLGCVKLLREAVGRGNFPIVLDVLKSVMKGRFARLYLHTCPACKAGHFDIEAEQKWLFHDKNGKHAEHKFWITASMTLTAEQCVMMRDIVRLRSRRNRRGKGTAQAGGRDGRTIGETGAERSGP